MFAAGACAYVLKDEMLPDLIEAVEAAADGQTYLSPSLTSCLPPETVFAWPREARCNEAEAVRAERPAGL